jgi:hypothetical protein
MERELQRLLDERAIRRCLTDYCRGIDRLDADLLRSVYHADRPLSTVRIVAPGRVSSTT